MIVSVLSIILKNIFMKNKRQLIKILIVSIFSSQIYSQNCPVTIPINSVNGTTLCLEGTQNQNENICFENNDGNLNFLLYGNANTNPPNLFTFSRLGNFSMGDKFSQYGKLSINGPWDLNTNLNDPIYKRDLSFEFREAGSAKIRSFRGQGWDTYIQFLTNPQPSTNPNYGDNPIVRMQIEANGDIAIKGDNAPNNDILNVTNKRDLSFDFLSAGSSKIRSFRGGNMDTYIQFLTNPRKRNGIDSSLNEPIVRMQINDDGKVLVGNVTVPTTPTQLYKLYVEGGILTEKVKVAIKTSTNWSDHVFEDKYKLKPLSEVEKYIKENKHLPNIPSSEELVKDGMDLGEMHAKQMEKIEELTLYMIEMKKEIEELKKENKELKEKVSNSKN